MNKKFLDMWLTYNIGLSMEILVTLAEHNRIFYYLHHGEMIISRPDFSITVVSTREKIYEILAKEVPEKFLIQTAEKWYNQVKCYKY